MEPLRGRFRERASRDLDLLRRHLAADDLGAAVVETTVHKLAGSAALFGFAEVGEAARDIDRVFSAGRRPDRELLEALLARLVAAVRAEAGTDPEAERPGRPAGATETILIVEDDDLLRAHAERALRGLGYQVICAADGDELLGGLEALPPVQLLFTDLMMPGAVSGEMLAREIQRRRPEVRVLFTSGRAGPRGDVPGGHFLAKPYRRDALAAMVRKVLDQPADDATT
ncbi:MAG: response regulator [Caulobacterales bacterium]|nr:response regulator [Caulobacterales bacterium]